MRDRFNLRLFNCHLLSSTAVCLLWKSCLRCIHSIECAVHRYEMPSIVECKCENYEYFINNHSPIYRYQFDCIVPLTTLIKENWLYRRRAPQIESTTSNAMIHTWSYLIDLSRIIFFFFASFVMLFITADNEVNWFALHSYDRPHRLREILFDFFMLIESANDWIET